MSGYLTVYGLAAYVWLQCTNLFIWLWEISRTCFFMAYFESYEWYTCVRQGLVRLSVLEIWINSDFGLGMTNGIASLDALYHVYWPPQSESPYEDRRCQPILNP